MNKLAEIKQMRGAWGKKCLESMGGRRIIDRVETMDSMSAGQEVGKWINGIITAADVSGEDSDEGSVTNPIKVRI